MTRLRAPFAYALLLALAFALLPQTAASPCATPCGNVTAEPFTSSSTAEGQGGGVSTQWVHCHLTQYPHTSTCSDPFVGPAYAGVMRGPSAGCAKGVLYANGNLVAQSLWVC